MSGYIASLLGRAFGDAPLLAPRTPSLFETVLEPAFEQTGEPGFEPIAGMTRASSPASIPEAVGSAAVSAEGAGKAVAPRETGEPIRATEPRSPAGGSANVPRASVVTAPPRLEIHESIATGPVLTPVVPARPASRRASGRLVTRHAGPRIEQSGSAITVPGALQRQAPLAGAVREPSEEGLIVEERIVAKESDPRIALPEPPRVRRAAPVLPPSPNAELSSRALSPPRARRPAESAPFRGETPAPGIAAQDILPRGEDPAIRVTIGRVDVRAVVKADAPRATRTEPRGPRLSLDDYLRMRDGGSR